MPKSSTTGKGRIAIDATCHNTSTRILADPAVKMCIAVSRSCFFALYTRDDLVFVHWCRRLRSGTAASCVARDAADCRLGPDRLSRDPTARMRDDSRYATGLTMYMCQGYIFRRCAFLIKECLSHVLRPCSSQRYSATRPENQVSSCSAAQCGLARDASRKKSRPA